MAHVAVAGLAEVLRDHEGTLGAAQAWCEQQNISSIHELKGKGDAAIDEFISAAGLEEFLHQFLVKRRIGEYAAVASAPAPAAKSKGLSNRRLVRRGLGVVLHRRALAAADRAHVHGAAHVAFGH